VLVVPAVGPGIATAARQFVEVAVIPTVPSIEYVIEGGDADADAAKMRNNAVPTAAAVKRAALMAPSTG
jgi:hypothetical protein